MYPPIVEIEPTIESWETAAQVLFWDFRLIPAGGREDIVGVRRIWCLLHGPSGLSLAPGSVVQSRSSSQTRSHIITANSLNQAGRLMWRG